MTKKGEKVVAIIPVRGGSKSIPRKNTRPFLGKPLMAWPIELAKSVARIDRVIITTDDDEMMEVARQYGAETLFKRPKELAEDTTPTLPVLQHCIQHLIEAEHYKPDIIALLYATSPLLKKERVEEALDQFENTSCNSVIGVVKDWRGHWMFDEARGKYALVYPKIRLNRQLMKPIYKEAGGISFSRADIILNATNTTLDIENTEFVFFEEGENVDIDNIEDFERALEKTKKLS